MALGLFAGFIIPIGQIMLAVLTALPLRGNLVVASTATLVTNPLTFPAIYYAAYRTGRAIVGDGALPAGGETMWLHEPGDWLAGATLPTILGLLVFALSGLVLGYLGVRLGWRGWIAWRWIRRPNRRQPSDAALLLSPLQLPPAFDLTAQPREGPAAGRSAS